MLMLFPATCGMPVAWFVLQAVEKPNNFGCTSDDIIVLQVQVGGVFEVLIHVLNLPGALAARCWLRLRRNKSGQADAAPADDAR